jgi:hypothetical protein
VFCSSGCKAASLGKAVKREKMASMETAISASLDHPNNVQMRYNVIVMTLTLLLA